ncbi:DUF3099 domain-containing protein [Glycomyces tarimensis]
MGRREKATVITDAQMSPDEELRIRTIRYVVMMSIRALLVVVCGLLVIVEAPLLWLWLPLGLVGMAALPWLAVMLANDRLAKDKRSLFVRHRQSAKRLPTPDHRMIDTE